MDFAALERLRDWDTPTICNGLEIVALERRTLGFTTQNMVCLDPSLPPIVGFARTATIRARHPSSTSVEEMHERRLGYYDYVGNGSPTICIIQDLDDDPGFGAFWGEVNTSVHKGLGCLGCVTNGSIRDLDACVPDFQLLAGKIGPSHAHVHVVDYGKDVNIFGMAVSDGDIIHADRHGAVVVPAEAVTKLPTAIDLLTRREAVVIEAAKHPDFNAQKLREAMTAQGDIH